jgi:hypothetical protein
MIGSSDGNHIDAADPNIFDAGNHLIERSTDPDRGCAVEHHLRHRSERFDIKAQRHRRKFRSKCLQRVDHARGRQHHVKDERDFRLKALQEASHLGAEPVHAVGDGARLRQDRAASLGQPGFARRLAVKQRASVPCNRVARLNPFGLAIPPGIAILD